MELDQFPESWSIFLGKKDRINRVEGLSQYWKKDLHPYFLYNEYYSDNVTVLVTLLKGPGIKLSSASNNSRVIVTSPIGNPFTM